MPPCTGGGPGMASFVPWAHNEVMAQLACLLKGRWRHWPHDSTGHRVTPLRWEGGLINISKAVAIRSGGCERTTVQVVRVH